MLRPLTMLVTLLAALALVRMARRRLRWDLPMVAMTAALVALGLAGLFDPERGELWSGLAIAAGLFLSQVPALLERAALSARIRRRYASAARWGLASGEKENSDSGIASTSTSPASGSNPCSSANLRTRVPG